MQALGRRHDIPWQPAGTVGRVPPCCPAGGAIGGLLLRLLARLLAVRYCSGAGWWLDLVGCKLHRPHRD